MNTYKCAILCGTISIFLLLLQTKWSDAVMGEKSYLDDIALSYEHGIFVCNQVICPPGTYGCRIERYSDPTSTTRVKNLNVCYVVENNKEIVTDSMRWTEYVFLSKKLSFYINSTIDAVSVCTYCVDTDTQNFKGIVNASEWLDFQKDFRNDVEAFTG